MIKHYKYNIRAPVFITNISYGCYTGLQIQNNYAMLIGNIPTTVIHPLYVTVHNPSMYTNVNTHSLQ